MKSIRYIFTCLFVSANINAEMSGINIYNLTQLYNRQIAKVLLWNILNKRRLYENKRMVFYDWLKTKS